jgi:hypothetical protein
MRYMMGVPFDIARFSSEDEIVYRNYFFSALVNTYIAHQVLKKHKPTSIFTSHGMYVDYAPSLFLGMVNGINSISWTSGFKEGFHYYSSPKDCDTLMPRRMSDASWEMRKNKGLTEQEETLVLNYLSNKYAGTESFDANFSVAFDNPMTKDKCKMDLGIKNDFPVVCLFAHLNWDACIDFSSMVFADSYEWTIESIKKMIHIKDVNWLIKPHPIEGIITLLHGVEGEIKKKFCQLPPHIKVLPAQLKINPYSFFQLIDVGITIMGTVGVELPCLGKPVITAGAFHFANKGFTYDASTKEQYFEYLENIRKLPTILPKAQIRLARQYAHSYFFERHIPLTILDEKQGHWGDVDFKKLKKILPGQDPVIDKICEGILSGRDIILDRA